MLQRLNWSAIFVIYCPALKIIRIPVHRARKAATERRPTVVACARLLGLAQCMQILPRSLLSELGMTLDGRFSDRHSSGKPCDFPVAGLWRRLVALLYDGFLVAAIWMVLGYLIQFAFGTDTNQLVDGRVVTDPCRTR